MGEHGIDPDTIVRIAIAIIGFLGAILSVLGGILIRRLYKSIDLLFEKIGELESVIGVLKLALLKSDPNSTVLFRALTERFRKSPK